MGFPSPAADYAESRISLDQQLIRHPSATYFMRAADSHHREGILQGALLVVDSSLTPVDGSLLVCAIEGGISHKEIPEASEPAPGRFKHREERGVASG